MKLCIEVDVADALVLCVCLRSQADELERKGQLAAAETFRRLAAQLSAASASGRLLYGS